ncbi:MAG: (2Fe-2S)-binding protein [Acidobacteriia bacterium]|nr:(2Fe-2S)-binding protein [Terriglobia bacterium]
MVSTVSFTLNGHRQRLSVDEDRRLLWVLRTDLALTGTKFGCGHGSCGACTVIVDRRAVRSCQTPVGTLAGKDVRTIEGLAPADGLHPLQRAFIEHQAYQCGFCTSGMLMAAYGLLLNVPHPSAADIVQRMDGNLCRCGSHTRIVAAINAASREPGGRS